MGATGNIRSPRSYHRVRVGNDVHHSFFLSQQKSPPSPAEERNLGDHIKSMPSGNWLARQEWRKLICDCGVE
uniref:Uncharacterized protein n=1 Tax=Physcomitrium patens TaxID=3218 RepID=A0A2K1KFU2_PHYPA|nr:hypothetical protein PHYPA_009003 [Physcomitrium patens]